MTRSFCLYFLSFISITGGSLILYHKLLHFAYYMYRKTLLRKLCVIRFSLMRKDSWGNFFLILIILSLIRINWTRQLVLFYFFFNNVEDHRRRRTIICKCLVSIEGDINDWIKLKRGVEKERNLFEKFN